ncbi:unnamed protein product [Malus baccata var. baccata]
MNTVQEVRLLVFLAFFVCCCNIFVIEVLLGDVGARKSSLVLRFVKEQFVEFQQSVSIPAIDIDSGSMSKQGRLIAIHKNCSAAARSVQIQTTPIRLPQH